MISVLNVAGVVPAIRGEQDEIEAMERLPILFDTDNNPLVTPDFAC